MQKCFREIKWRYSCTAQAVDVVSVVCVVDVAATRQDDSIVSGGDPVNNSANIVWHFERVLRDDDDDHVSRGVGRSACAYTSTSLVAIATLLQEHIVPLDSCISWNRPYYVPSVSNNMICRTALAIIVLMYCLRFIVLLAMRFDWLAPGHRPGVCIKIHWNEA